jgi:hypothetical protein
MEATRIREFRAQLVCRLIYPAGSKSGWRREMKHDVPQGALGTNRRREDAPGPGHFLGTAPPSAGHSPVWEIHRKTLRGINHFEIYLDGKRIGEERSASELRELLAGVRLACDDANRVITTLKTCPLVYVEVQSGRSSACRKPGPERRH